MKLMPWVLLVIALLIIIFQWTCTNSELYEQNVKISLLEKKYMDTLSSYQQFRYESTSALDNATAIAVQANEQANISQQALDRERHTVSLILKKLDSAETEDPDSSWVYISPRFKSGCDSLRKANLSLNFRILQYEQDIQSHIDALGYEINLRDSLLDKERGFNAEFQRQLNNCVSYGKKVEKNYSAQKYQLYGGIGIWGQQSNILKGGEINLSLKTPKDAIFEIKSAYLTNSWWFGIGTKFKFKF